MDGRRGQEGAAARLPPLRLPPLQPVVNHKGNLALRVGGSAELYQREGTIFRNSKTRVDRYVGGDPEGEALAVKSTTNQDELKWFAAHKGKHALEGTVPTELLRGRDGRPFVLPRDRGRPKKRIFFVMPCIRGPDLVEHRKQVVLQPDAGWQLARLALQAVQHFSRVLLRLWRHSRAVYHDVKARNLMLLRPPGGGGQPAVRGGDLCLCDLGSINTVTATHHPPPELCRQHPRHSPERYRLYVAWGLTMLVAEVVLGSEPPKAVRALRDGPAAAQLEAYRGVVADIRAAVAGCKIVGPRVERCLDYLQRVVLTPAPRGSADIDGTFRALQAF